MNRYVVTGGAGFIGSALVRALLAEGREVHVIDNLSSGTLANLKEVESRIVFHNLDLCHYAEIAPVVAGAHRVFHLAAIPSVPKSIDQPVLSHEVNINGTFNLFRAAAEGKVGRVVYAASSSAYGDTAVLPKVETMNPQPKSPYALQKLVGEYYASVFSNCFHLQTLSLRFFNVFGPRQDPSSPYSGVLSVFMTCRAVAVDASGFLYIADTGNQRVRKVVNGTINTVAGNGSTGYSGDGGSALSAMLNSPSGLVVDSAGDIFIADFGNNVVRKVSIAGIISTVAGNDSPGYSGDGGLATSAQLAGPTGLVLDASGNLYIADSGNHVVRVVTPGGNISTFAGNGGLGYSGDGGLAVNAQLATPVGLTRDAAGNLYISDSGANVIRMVTPAGLIITIGGNGAVGYAGDGAPATQAKFNTVLGIGLDTEGDLYVADSGNNAIRLLQFVAPVPGTGVMANAASNIIGAVAPGEAITLYGTGIGPTTLVPSQPDQFGNTPLEVAGLAFARAMSVQQRCSDTLAACIRMDVNRSFDGEAVPRPWTKIPERREPHDGIAVLRDE